MRPYFVAIFMMLGGCYCLCFHTFPCLAVDFEVVVRAGTIA